MAVAQKQARIGEVWNSVSVDTLGGLADQEAPPRPKLAIVGIGAAAAAALLAATLATQGWRQGLLLVVGLALGATLYHARFGFASAFRQLAAVGQGRGLRAHLLMLAAGSILFAGILSFGHGIGGIKVRPETTGTIGVSLILGAFLFGVGMQLGGACASGTLFAIGGGQSAIVITLVGFVAGSALGAWHWGFWVVQAPHLPPVLYGQSLGYGPALVLQLVVLGAIGLISLAVERRRRPPLPADPPTARGVARVLRGSWPLWAGAIALAALNGLTLLLIGKPWGVTSAFALWGSKIAVLFGVHAGDWAYWHGKAASLNGSLLADTTSITDFGIILGALIAAGLSGTFLLHRRIPGRVALAALAGGILMGYGARLAFGCNIGAYFGGIVSFSLHGWIWGVMAIGGTYAGMAVRPLFGMAKPKPSDGVC